VGEGRGGGEEERLLKIFAATAATEFRVCFYAAERLRITHTCARARAHTHTAATRLAIFN